MSSILFKGNWISPWSPSPYQEKFTLFSGEEKEVKYIFSRSTEFEYFKDEEFEGISMPYAGDRLIATIIVPSVPVSSHFTKIISNLNQQLDKVLLKFSRAKGEVHLPQFRVEYTGDLNKMFQVCGMDIAFSPLADFSNLTVTPEGLQINKFMHTSVFEIASTSNIPPSSSSDLEFSMKVTSPFIVLVRDVKTNIVLFLGVVNDFNADFDPMPVVVSTAERPSSPPKMYIIKYLMSLLIHI